MTGYDLSRAVMARLRETADIVAVVGEHVTLRKSGRSHLGLCPFHGEKTPSFSVSREKGTYYCFGCKRGGDVIDFIMELERSTFVEAVESLAQRFGVELPAASPEARRRREEQDSVRSVLDVAQAFYARHLGDDRPRAFLERRGVSLETAAGFGLGFAPPDWRTLYDSLRRNHAERILVDAGLVVRGDGGRYWDRFRDRITIPIRNSRGVVIGFGARSVGDDHPKYLNSPETAVFSKSHVLFGLDRCRRAFSDRDRAVVVEGYFDCIALHLAGCEETVATLGTALTDHHARELARRVGRVVVCYDGDEAGRLAAQGAVRTLLAVNLDVGVVLLPHGEDPDDVARRGGAEAVAEMLAGALDPAAFLLGQMGRTRDERRRTLGQALEVVDACPDAVRRYHLREQLALGAGIPVDRLGTLQTHRVSARTPAPPFMPPAGETALLRALLVDLPAPRRAECLGKVPSESVQHPVTRRLLAGMSEIVSQGRALEISELTADIDERDARRVLAALEHEAPETQEENFLLITRELWERYRQHRLAELTTAITRARQSQDTHELTQLLAEKSALIRQRIEP